MGCAASTAAGAFRHCAPVCCRLLPVWWPVHASRNDSVSTARTPDVVPTGTDSKGQELLPSSAPADAQTATPPAVVLEEPPDTAAQPVAPVEAATSPLGDRDDAAAATAASSSRTMMQKSTDAVASARSGATGKDLGGPVGPYSSCRGLERCVPAWERRVYGVCGDYKSDRC